MSTHQNKQTFKLNPFPQEIIPKLNIHGFFQCEEDSLQIHFHLDGDDFKHIIWPNEPQTTQRVRKIGIWSETCFEVFVKDSASPLYWEFNWSPHSSWNFFHFKSHRGSPPAESESPIFNQSPPVTFALANDHATFDVQIPITKFIGGNSPFELGITMVVITKGNPPITSYWALTHRKNDLDFHNHLTFTPVTR